jgi:hypothetical protein
VLFRSLDMAAAAEAPAAPETPEAPVQ